MAPPLAPPPGIADIMPSETPAWRLLETAAREVFATYGYGELRPPVIEYTEVFTRGLGDDTEVVRKEMYTFADRGGRSLTLRPEGTAGVMRALLATEVLNGVEQRVYYLGPMFRGERPAAGRRRQFHQIGVENAGRMAPELDAECMAMLLHYLEACGITGARLLINTRGAAADRAPASASLREFFLPHRAAMCEDCRERLERNPWRILDCKQEQCQSLIAAAPPLADLLQPSSREYFARVVALLEALKIPHELAPRLVRGLDYYVHTVFEVVHDGLGAQSALAGGGRYELLLPGAAKPMPGVGFALGMERLLMARDAEGLTPPPAPTPTLFLVGLGPAARQENLTLAMRLRHTGLAVLVEVEDRSLKAQLRSAAKSGARFAVIRGDQELAANRLVIKNLADGTQAEIAADQIDAYLHEHGIQPTPVTGR